MKTFKSFRAASASPRTAVSYHLVTIGALLLHVNGATAQRAFGELEKVSVVGQLQQCPNVLPGKSSAAEGIRIRGTPAAPPRSLMTLDSLTVDRHVDGRVQMVEYGKSMVVLAPSILCQREILLRGDTTVRGVLSRQGADAIYKLIQPTIALDGTPRSVPGILLRSGGLVIDWKDKSTPLVIDVATRRLVVRGTRLAVAVDAAGNAIVYVQQGTVVVENNATQASQNATTLAEQTPYYVNGPQLTPLQVPGFDDAVKYNGRDVWMSPLRRLATPRNVLIGSAGVVALAVLLTRESSSGYEPPGSNNRDGTVIVRFPFRR